MDTNLSQSSERTSLSSATSGPALNLEDRSSKWGKKLWTITLDLPGEKVNKLGSKVIGEFEALLPRLEQLAKEGKIDVLVLQSGKAGNFIAGADIKMIQSAKSAEDAERLSAMGQKLLNRWEDLPFPRVAAINGAALGGGCEFSLACTAIVMSNDPAARIGLPEVMLGLLPGMGGCVRLPQRLGIAQAFDMILTGKTLTGERAYKAGLADACLPRENFSEGAQRWAVSQLDALKSGRRIAKEPKLGGMGGAMGSFLESALAKGIVFKKARDGVLSKTRGKYPAPLEAIQVVCDTGTGYGKKLRGEARDRAMAREAKGFGKLAATEASKNLIRLFFLTEDIKKSNGLPPGTNAQGHKVASGGVLGAGVMGGGIAHLFAEKGLHARMKDLNTAALATGIQAAARLFKKDMQKRKITPRQYMQKINHIAPILDFSGFGSVDVVVEAVVERMDIKKKVVEELEGHVSDDCVIASNTSSLSISEMQSGMKKPERFVGMHFFNPVHKMPLIEVIRGSKTSDEAVATIFDLSKKLGKTPVVVKDSPGFLVNRLLGAYMIEAIYVLADGVPIDEIDNALLDFGMPMGPIELIDEVGIDVADKVGHILHDAFGERMRGADLNQKLLTAKRLGKKSAMGFYAYSGKDNREKSLDPKIYEVLGITPKRGAISAEDIVERCVLPMINDAARCLEEGVVASVSEVDLAMIMGTGFPPFRGGLLRYADSLGAQTIVDKLEKHRKRFAVRFEPSPALLNRAKHGQKFYTT